jgi:hypothetical protein
MIAGIFSPRILPRPEWRPDGWRSLARQQRLVTAQRVHVNRALATQQAGSRQ